jgi:hypothetical protein
MFCAVFFMLYMAAFTGITIWCADMQLAPPACASMHKASEFSHTCLCTL